MREVGSLAQAIGKQDDTVLDALTGRPCAAAGRATIPLYVELFDRPVRLSLALSGRPMHLRELVPLAGALDDIFAAMTRRAAEESGLSVPCGQGCSACCRHCLIPLSEPEGLHVAARIAALPTPLRQSWQRRFHTASAKVLSHARGLADRPGRDQPGLDAIARWYYDLKLPCLFLESNRCSAYDQRPLACREHFAVGQAAHCDSASPRQGRAMEMPIRMSNLLSRLSSEFTGGPVGSIMLPLAMPWANDNPALAARTWSEDRLVGRLAALVVESAVLARVGAA